MLEGAIMLKERAFVIICLLLFVLLLSGFRSIEDLKSELDNLVAVAEETKDPQTMEIAAFLQNNAIMAEPNEKGIRILEESKDGNWVAVVSLLEKDGETGEHWKGILNVNSAANFLFEIRTIVLKNGNFGPTGKAIVLLHEGFHALSFAREPYEEREEKEFCLEEVAAHTFQNKLMLLLGKEKYQRLLEKEVCRMEKEAKSLGGKPGDAIPGLLENPELAEIFGNPVSENESDFIQTNFWIHAAFVFIEKNYKGDVKMQKAAFLQALYEQEGVL